jgi:hypothetical protein
MNPQTEPHPEDQEKDDFPAPNLPHLSPWTRWPILMYLAIVVVFGILAIFVVHYVLTHVPGNS